MDKDELIDIWREVVLKNTTNGSCNFQQAAIDFAELVAKPWVETNKALANEIIELQKQTEQEPVAFINWNAATGERTVSFFCESELASEPLYAHTVQQLEQRPLGTAGALIDKWFLSKSGISENALIYAAPVQQAEQESVAWTTFKASELSDIAKRIDADDSEGIDSWSWRMGALWAENRLQVLNATPVRTKDLTDDEIDEIGKSYFDEWSFGFARAVIAADREKNLIK